MGSIYHEAPLTLTECTLQLGVYTPKPLCYHSHRSVHSNHTPNIIGVHWDATAWTWLNYSPIEIHSNATSSALQVECTLHCHSHNLVFVHIYTPIPLRGLRIFVHKIATLQCHSMHFNIFILRNIHSNATSRTCIIYALCWACKLINWYTCHFHF